MKGEVVAVARNTEEDQAEEAEGEEQAEQKDQRASYLELDVYHSEDGGNCKSKHDLCHCARLNKCNKRSKPQLSLHFCELPIIKGCLVA